MSVYWANASCAALCTGGAHSICVCVYAMQSRNPMYMRTKGRAWEAVFVGEGSQDAGVRRHAEVVLWVLGGGFVTLVCVRAGPVSREHRPDVR